MRLILTHYDKEVWLSRVTNGSVALSAAAICFLPRRGWLMAADTAAVLILVLTVVGRMLSGVHWFTDIVAGVILSAALIALFCLALQYTEERYGRAGTADSRK